jgi:hypothetical protein
MSKLLTETENFRQRATACLQGKFKDAFNRIAQQNADYEKFIAGSDAFAAMGDLNKLTDIKNSVSTTIPPYLNYGHLIAYTKGGNPMENIHIPLLLPCTDNNAVLFEIEDAKPAEISIFFQIVALRYLLSMKMKVCKFYMIDSNFGNSFAFFANINNSQLHKELIYKSEDINKLMSDLAKTVSQANQSYLGSYPNLTACNEQAGIMAQPYHFVFISDFPNGFSGGALDNLYNLINNNNANKAGIQIFINYNKSSYLPRDFDINKYRNICSCISTRSGGGETVIRNWNINIPIPKYRMIIDTALPANAGKLVAFINQIQEEKVTFTLDNWIDKLKQNNKVWSDTTVNGINVPIGYTSPTQTFNFYLANDNDSSCNDYFSLVTGRPGYGKTVFLDNIIVNACFRYSPEELNLYLADFKNGISFSKYRDLPHAKTLMLANNREYALRILNHILEETERRGKLYKKAEIQSGQVVDKLSVYRKITGDPMPRILLIMDEFQNLYQSVDMVSITAREKLVKGIREWRAFGISVILCTQTLSGVNFGEANDLITYRFALNSLEMDSKLVLRNSAAKFLTRKGQTIMNNTADGNEQMNVEFQCAFTPRYLEHVKYLAQTYRQRHGAMPAKYICESGTDADIADNQDLSQRLIHDSFAVNHQYCDVFVGKPDLLRNSHTRIRYRRQQNSNTLITGGDFATAINTVAVSLAQLYKQSSSAGKFYVVDCFNAGDEYQGALNGMSSYSSGFITGNAQSIVAVADSIAVELEKRKQTAAQGLFTEERLVLAVLNTQNCYELKPQQSGMIPMPSATATKLAKILNEGPPLGIHCIIHSLNYTSLFGTGAIFQSSVSNYFENRIFLKGADIQNILLGIKLSPVGENGQMTVLNAKLDREEYEQCSAYSKISIKESNATVDFISQLFKQNAYVQYN